MSRLWRAGSRTTDCVMVGGRRVSISDIILGVWNGYAVLLMLLARLTPAVEVETEVVAAAEGSAYSGGRKAQSHTPARTFLLLTNLTNLAIANGERDSGERREAVGTLSAVSQASVKPSNGVGQVLMPVAV